MFKEPNIALAYAKGRNREMRRDAARYREVATLRRSTTVVEQHDADPYGSAHRRGDWWPQENSKQGLTLPRFGGQGVKQVQAVDDRAAHRPPG